MLAHRTKPLSRNEIILCEWSRANHSRGKELNSRTSNTGGLQLATLQQHRWALPLQHMNQPYWCNSFKPKAIRVGFFLGGWPMHTSGAKFLGHPTMRPYRQGWMQYEVLIWFKFTGGQMTLLSVSTQQTYSNHIAITIWLLKAWGPVNGKISTKLLLLLYHYYPTRLEQRKAGHTGKEFTWQALMLDGLSKFSKA